MTDHVFLLRRLPESYTEFSEIGPIKFWFGRKLMSSIDKLGILNLVCSSNSHAFVDIEHAESGRSFDWSCLDRNSYVAPRLTKLNYFYLSNSAIVNDFGVQTKRNNLIWNHPTPDWQVVAKRPELASIVIRDVYHLCVHRNGKPGNVSLTFYFS